MSGMLGDTAGKTGDAMSIVSSNFNPNNDSKFARRKNIFKGQTNALSSYVDWVEKSSGFKLHEYCGAATDVVSRFNAEWGDAGPSGAGGGSIFHCHRALGVMTNSFVAKTKPSNRMLKALPQELHKDLHMIWEDITVIFYRRFGNQEESLSFGISATANEIFKKTGQSLLVWAYGPKGFDFIVSKHGYDAPYGGSNPHYYIWQARLKGGPPKDPVDDF
jgi:hypothetical protein